MEVPLLPTTFEAKMRNISFGLATRQEICKASISDCPISHASQLSNPFLGLPLESGKCESCGTGEAGQCEGHFGYIELPTSIYHPDHVGELKRMLSLLCLKCLKLKNRKLPVKNSGIVEKVLSGCCEETSQMSINEVKTTDGACYLELKLPARLRPHLTDGFWNFLEKYGFRYGDRDTLSRPLLPSEVMSILKKIPKETKKKLLAKGYFPQDGYIIQCLPVPPNCLSVPDVSDGISTMSTDHSIALLKKVLRQVEIIKSSRSGKPNFESQEIEANDLQVAVMQYLQFRGTGKATRDVDTRFGVKKEINMSSTKAWLEKMKTLFIRKGSGFSSRSVITGDPFKGVSEIGLPFEIAQKITVEERVNEHNREFLQRLVDEKLCLTYRDGMLTYSLREGSKGHTFLRPGQVVHRRIMDGDIVFINRPPTTHKHSLQALSVYVHDDHTVKINPLICSPLSADFDGDCIHLFYPQSLEAKAEAVELFLVEKQLLSSHTGNFNLQLATDSLLSLKLLFRKCFLKRALAEQLAMFVPNVLSKPAVIKSDSGPLWTASQILQISLPRSFDSYGERHNIAKSEVLSIEFSRDAMGSILNDLVTSLFFLKGPKEVLAFFNAVQPLLMESLFTEGFSVSLRDFYLPRDVLESTLENIKKISTDFIAKSSAIGYLIDSKSESALTKVVQQIGFLGMQISRKGKFYTEALVNDMSSMFEKKYPSCDNYPNEGFGLVDRPLFRGLDPYQEMVHSISSREVIVRSSRGLTEPGTLFKNLMAILRDVVICSDGTVRNMCSNSIIQFEYGINSASMASEFCAGDPVGVLAATAMSNPAYKAVLDSSPSSNNSWEMMKEILQCGVNFKNDVSDRRVILCLNSCNCGRKHCQENAALIVQNQLKKVSLKDTAIEFLIEYQAHESFDNAGLVGHVHLNKTLLMQLNITMDNLLEKCQGTINQHQKKKKVGFLFKQVVLSSSNCCSFCLSSKDKETYVPCIQFLWQGARDGRLEMASQLLADNVYPVLLETIIKGDPRVSSAKVVWISPNTETWIRSPSKNPVGELALDVILEKSAVKKSGDAWRIVMDSCIPVIQLIDTQRSTPYGIKQIQELLGISCAFEQGVQRLATSVTMVTKGVLKDHLLLLGNSMTYAGTLIGFNTGGIKYLSRSLDVQAPFMNATLSTPRRCFERASEKCHVDNLSSIVASCAWGKHVSVGTGSPFEILWDTRKAELIQDKEIDVYDFLRDVNSGSVLEGMGTDCLGTEIEDLDEEDLMEYDLSPERESGQEKPTFEDGPEFGLNGDDTNVLCKEGGGWSSWGKKDDSEVNDWAKKLEPSSGWCKKVSSEAEQSTWGKKVSSEGNDRTTDAEQSTWGKKVGSDGSNWVEKPEGSTWGEKTPSKKSDWGKKADESTWGKSSEAEQSTWGKKVSSQGNDWTTDAEQSTWGKKVGSDGSNWAEKPEGSTGGEKTPSKKSNWAKNVDSREKDWGKNADESTWGKTSDWGKEPEQNTWGKSNSGKSDWIKEPEKSNWGKKNSPEKSDWTKKVDSGSVDWGKEPGQNTWGKSNSEKNDWSMKVDSGARNWSKEPEKSNWGKKNNPEKGEWTKKVDSRTGGWAKETEHNSEENIVRNKPEQSAWSKQADSMNSGWTRTVGQSNADTGAQDSSAWGRKVDSGDGGGWGKKAEQNTRTTSSPRKPSDQSDWATASVGKDWGGNNDTDTPKIDNQSSWDAPGSDVGSLNASDDPWGSKLANQTTQATPSTWGSSNDWGKLDSQSSPGKKKESPFDGWGSGQKHVDDSTGSQGWGSTMADTNSEKDARPQWGRGRGRGRGWGRGGRSRDGPQGRGPSNDGDWKTRRTRPGDDPSAPGLFSATRQRLDNFTVEEQDVLSETESVMKNIRRIISQTIDGDPLSADDQNFIIENVLNHHPDKAAKTGTGIKHITVMKHEQFQDSRCFYVVSVDENKADFSYRKCLENFIRAKHPDKAEAFIPKYFRKPQPRQGWSRDRPPQNEAGTPGWNQDSASTPSHTPAPTPTPDEAGTPSWNKDKTDDDTGTPVPRPAPSPGWN